MLTVNLVQLEPKQPFHSPVWSNALLGNARSLMTINRNATNTNLSTALRLSVDEKPNLPILARAQLH